MIIYHDYPICEYDTNIPLVQLLYAGDDVSGSTWDSRNWNLQKGIRANLIQCAVELIKQL